MKAENQSFVLMIYASYQSEHQRSLPEQKSCWDMVLNPEARRMELSIKPHCNATYIPDTMNFTAWLRLSYFFQVKLGFISE